MKRRNFLKLFGGSAALVNFTDFAELAKQWLETKDVEDLAEFADSWLTEKSAPLQDSWTISFFWRPESSSREIHGEIPIALIKDIAGDYLMLAVDGDDFKLSDGTNDFTVTASDGWKFEDVIKFAIVRDEGNDITLYVETPAEGTLDESDSDVDLTEAVHFVQFSANADKEIKGIGAYGELKMWNSDLAEADVQKVFDLDDTAPTVTVNKTVGQMLFERDGIAFINRNKIGTGVEFDLAEEGQARIKDITVSQRSRLDVYDSNGKRAWTVYENQILLQNSPADEKIISTEDGVTFTELIDFSDHPEFPYPRPANTNVNSIGITPDGSWLVSLGQGREVPSQLYRKAAGLDPADINNWDMVLTVDPVGNVANFGWTAMRGSEIAFVVYGQKPDSSNPDITPPTAVYYSPDDGVSWGKIFELNEDNYAHWFNRGEDEGGWGLHGHCLSFHPSTTDTLFIAYGDGVMSGIMRIDYTGGTKTDSNNWESYSDTPIYYSEPTSAIVFKGYIYWGLDATDAEATVFRMHPDTHEFQSVNVVGHPRWSASTELYYLSNNRAWVFSMAVVDGLLYAACFDQSAQEYGGLYVTADGENWVCVNNIEGHDGLRFLAGMTDDGYLWGWYRETAGTEKLFRMNPVKAKMTQAAIAERAANNQNSGRDYSDPGQWSIDGLTNIKGGDNDDLDPVLSQSDEEALFGGHCLKVEFPEGVVSGSRVVPRCFTMNDANLNDGDLILLSYYYKAAEGTSELIQPIIDLQYSTEGDGDVIVVSGIPGGLGKTSPQKGWHRLDFWAKADIPEAAEGDAVTTLRIRVRLAVEDALTAGHNLAESVFYIDGLSCVIMPENTLFMRTDFIPPDTPRADEHLVASVAKLSSLVEP